MKVTRKVWRIYSNSIILAVLALILSALTLLSGVRWLFWVQLGVAILGITIAGINLSLSRKILKQHLDVTFASLTRTDREAAAAFPLPFLILSASGEIVWHNELFDQEISGGEHILGQPFARFFPEVAPDSLCMAYRVGLERGGRHFQAYGEKRSKGDMTTYIIYFFENTDSWNIEQAYTKSRPVVIHVVIDNYEEVIQRCKDSDRVRLSGQLEEVFERYGTKYHALLKRVNRDRYLMVTEEQHLQQMVDSRFQILEQVRSIKMPDRYTMTLSIGVGHQQATLEENDVMAKQAVEMALGRGGDQAAIHTESGYDFYGGVSQGVEKQTRVKTRLVASAILEIIGGADRCLVMGHRYADLDCFGSAVGLATAIRRLGKETHLVIDPSKNLVGNLLSQMKKNGYNDLFLSPEDALPTITRKTLLFITDTHVAAMLESKEVFEKCGNNVVVIDHHRRMVDYINNAVVFFHEPFASSASEMVTELIQYFGEGNTPKPMEAEALLAGITLDTKNFVLKTGVRTFEAAAFLRRYGADTVAVKKLFSSSIEAYQMKAEIVSNAAIYRECAIAASPFPTSDTRIVAPQSADELLSISGVKASFVLFNAGGKIQISARSMGEVNVQLVMETLGGGGHLTMAGAALETTMEEASFRVREAIDRYFLEQVKQLKKGSATEQNGDKK